jgi:hypothetical protein
MAQSQAPNPPQREFQFIDTTTGRLTQYGLTLLDEIWRRIADGYATIPCNATMAANVVTLTPTLHEQGANTYADGLIFSALMYDTSSGDVTAKVASGTKELAEIKVLKDDGAAQAGSGDIDSGKLYLFVYHSALDGGAGAFVLK